MYLHIVHMNLFQLTHVLHNEVFPGTKMGVTRGIGVISCKIPFKIIIFFYFFLQSKENKNKEFEISSHQPTVALSYSQTIKIIIGPSDQTIIPLHFFLKIVGF